MNNNVFVFAKCFRALNSKGVTFPGGPPASEKFWCEVRVASSNLLVASS